MDNPLTQLLQSRKAWLGIVAIAALTVLTVLGKMPVAQLVDVIKWIVSTLIAALATEKAALYLGPYPNGNPPTSSPAPDKVVAANPNVIPITNVNPK